MKLMAKFYVDNKVVKRTEARDISAVVPSDNPETDLYPLVVYKNDGEWFCCEEIDYYEE